MNKFYHPRSIQNMRDAIEKDEGCIYEYKELNLLLHMKGSYNKLFILFIVFMYDCIRNAYCILAFYSNNFFFTYSCLSVEFIITNMTHK